MSRPQHERTVSTNLGAGSGYRSLEGRVAIVTGASRGIGAAVSRNLASKGCSLVMNYTSDSSKPKTESLAYELTSTYGIKALPVQADMGSETGPGFIVTTAKNHFQHPKTGKFQVDIVINNAGVSVNRKLEDCDCEDFAFQYNVNVRGPLLLVKAASPYLPHDRSGRIVNVSSVSSKIGYYYQSVYAGTKAALESMTRTWSRELAERCTVNAINPGPVATDMYGGAGEDFQRRNKPWIQNAPLAAVREGIDRDEFAKNAEADGGRPAYEDEIAGIVGMLCSEESGWCTGSVVCANGGMIMGT